MFRKLTITAIAALFSVSVSAACLNPDNSVNDDHYAYWVDSQGETWRTSDGVCWRTINDESYHNSLEEALACGDAEEVSRVVITRLLVHFNFDKDLLRSVDTDAVLDAVETIKSGATGDVTVSIVGHTDSVGSEGYNMALGLRRAGTLAAFLRARGVDVASIDTMGESDPVASNSTSDGRAQNRRAEGTIEIVITEIRRL